MVSVSVVGGIRAAAMPFLIWVAEYGAAVRLTQVYL